MKVVDATFLIDYLDDIDAATEYLTTHSSEEFIIPLPAFAEAIVGEGNQPGEADLQGVQQALDWAEVYEVQRNHAILGAQIADEIEPSGPYLAGMDALIAAVGRELDAPVVSDDSDLTHVETKNVIDVEEYK